MFDLTPIEARAEAATAGPWTSPWTVDTETPQVEQISGPNPDDPIIAVEWYDGPHLAMLEPDAAFICHARQDIPDLIAEVKRLRQYTHDERRKNVPIDVILDVLNMPNTTVEEVMRQVVKIKGWTASGCASISLKAPEREWFKSVAGEWSVVKEQVEATQG